MSSCGVVRFRNAPSYHAGPAQKTGYAQEGIIEEVLYDCSVPGPTRRRMLVYLPKDYYENQRRYPVFYLLHGARGYETSWVKKGFVYAAYASADGSQTWLDHRSNRYRQNSYGKGSRRSLLRCRGAGISF